MKKVLALLSGVAMGLFVFNGCDALNPTANTDSASITLQSDTVNVTAGQSAAINGSVDASDVPTITYTPSSNAISVPASVLSPTEKKFNLSEINLVVTAASNAATGVYTLTINVTVGTATMSKIQYVKVNGGSIGTEVEVSEVTLGSSKNLTTPSSLDLDAMITYGGSAAAAKLTDIDLCYAYSGTDKVDKLFSPAQAKLSGFDFTSSWTATANSTKFYKLSGVDFNSITTVEALEALWLESSAQTASLAAAKNDVFIAKTNLGAIVLLLIADQTTGSTGTILLKAAK